MLELSELTFDHDKTIANMGQLPLIGVYPISKLGVCKRERCWGTEMRILAQRL